MVKKFTVKTEEVKLRLPKEVVQFMENAAAKEINKMSEEKKPLLQRANELISGDRQTNYGNKLQNFAQIAMFWNATLATKLTSPVTPEDVALCMMGVKMARLAKSPDHEDSILDVAGYAGCYEALQAERQINSDHGQSKYTLRGITMDANDHLPSKNK
jgi:hypothetical protein